MIDSLNIPQLRRFYRAPFTHFIPYQAITLGGAGGVGSWLSVILAKMGFPHVDVWDYDHVEEVNLGGQLFTKSDAVDGITKIDGVQHQVNAYSNTTNKWRYFTEFNNDSEVNPISIAAFDNMKARRLIFDKWVESDFSAWYEKIDKQVGEMLAKQFSGNLTDGEKHHIKLISDATGEISTHEIIKPLYIDVRMIAESFQLIFITPDTIDEYDEYMFDDSEVPAQDCSYRATTYTGACSASMIAAGIANHLSGLTPQTFNEFDFPILL